MAHRTASSTTSLTGAKSRGGVHHARVTPQVTGMMPQSSSPRDMNQEKQGILRTLFHRERAATISRQLRIRPQGYATLHHAEIGVISNRSPNAVVTITAWNKSDAVNAVCELLDIAYNDAPKQQLRILLENDRMARLIGQAGKVIQPIREAHPDAKIQFYPRYAPLSDERILQILAPSSKTAAIFRQMANQMPFIPLDTKVRPYWPNSTRDGDFHNWGGYSPDDHEFRDTSTPVREMTSTMPRKKNRPADPPCLLTTSNLPTESPTLTPRQQLLPASATSQQGAQEATSNPQTLPAIAELAAQTNALRQIILQHRQMTTSQAPSPVSSARLEDAPLNPLWQPAAGEWKPEMKAYVFGESHIRAAHHCTLKELLKENQVNVARYADIGGARYSRLEKMVITALNEAEENTVVTVIAGSNDCRDLAKI